MALPPASPAWDDSLRLLAVYAALRVFFFTLLLFLVVLGELRFSRAMPELVTLASGFFFWVFRSTDSCSHSAPLRTVPLLSLALRLLCHSSEPSSPAISRKLRLVSTE